MASISEANSPRANQHLSLHNCRSGSSPRRSRQAREMHEACSGLRRAHRAIVNCFSPRGSCTTQSRGTRKPLSRSDSCGITTFGPADQATFGGVLRPDADPAEAMTIRKRRELFGNGQLVRFGVSSPPSARTSPPHLAYAGRYRAFLIVTFSEAPKPPVNPTANHAAKP